MVRRPNSPHCLVTSAALVVGLTLSSMPAVALAAPPTLPADQPAAQPQPAPQPVTVQPAQPAPQPIPEPAAGAGWEDPTAAPQVQPQPQPTYAQPQPTGYAQPQPPPPTYAQPMPQPLPPPRANPNKGLGLVISGFSIFSVSYLFSALGGVIAIDAGAPEIGRPMLIPVVGPFIAGGKSGGSATGAFGLAFVGVIQLAGLSMGTAGAVVLGKSRRAARLSASSNGFQLQF